MIFRIRNTNILFGQTFYKTIGIPFEFFHLSDRCRLFDTLVVAIQNITIISTSVKFIWCENHFVINGKLDVQLDQSNLKIKQLNEQNSQKST